MKIFVIGDIHGCYNTLVALFDKLPINYDDDKIIFLGDYIDRGTHNVDVVDFVISKQLKMGKDRCVALLGNHEQMMIDAFDTKEVERMDLWLYNGGLVTCNEYKKLDQRILETHLNWMRGLPHYVIEQGWMLSHSGSPHSKINKNLAIWDREWINKTGVFIPVKGTKRAIFGHTPTLYITGERKAIGLADGSYGIDTAAISKTGKLCCAVLDGDNISFVYQDNIESRVDNDTSYR